MIPLPYSRAGGHSKLLLIAAAWGLTSCVAWCLDKDAQSPPSHPVSREARSAFPELNRLIDANQLQQAETELRQRVASGGENYKTLYYQALILFKQGQFSQSLKTLERSFVTQKYDPDLYFLAGLDWVALNRIKLAVPFYMAAAQLAPTDFQMHYHLGRAYYTDQQFEKAEREFRRVLELNPTFVKGYDNLGLALEALGEEAAAIESYRKAIDLNEQQRQGNEWPYINLAEFLIKKNRFDDALELAQKATILNPRSAEAYFALGEALNKKGKEQEAVKALNIAAQNDPQYSKPHYLLGQIYRKLGLLEEAKRELLTFQELNRTEKQNKPSGGG
ncbi:MAG TPA: tetratricopeptide repeat protein [Terriglobia bacterium]|nr:tetratricopeptide repeat protein [Terriglobia bacterium]